MQSNWVSASVAAKEAELTPQGFRRWCERIPGLARFVGGRWRVDPVVLRRVLEGHEGGQQVGQQH